MGIIELQQKENVANDVKLSEQYAQIQSLLSELRERNLPDDVIGIINQKISEINSSTCNDKELRRVIKTKQEDIMYHIVRLKIVPKKHYKRLGLSFGPLAGYTFVVLALTLFNDSIGGRFFLILPVFIIGVGVGMLITTYIGVQKDKKAFAEGRQLKTNVC